MILTLKNIRQHKNKTYTFPDSGIVKLVGPSGKGKSSIFDAMLHALFGNMDDMVNWDKDSGEIELDYLGLKITRHMRPNNLKVIDSNGKIWSDDAAQAVINSTLGMTEQETMATSYLIQGMDDSLFKMKPAPQLQFLQKLAFGEDDPEIIKEKIKELKTRRTSMLESAESELVSLNQQANDIQQKITKLELQRPVVPKDLISQEELDKTNIELTRLRALSTKISTEISKLNKEMADPAYDKSGSHIALKEQLKRQTAETNLTIQKCHEDLAKLPELLSAEDLTAGEQNIKILTKSLEYYQVVHEAKELSQKTKEAYGIVGSPIAWLSESIAEHEAAIASASFRYSELDNELSNIKKQVSSIPCPYCDKPLKLLKNQIVKHDHPVDVEKETYRITTELVALDTDRRNHSGQLTVKRQQLNRLQNSKESISKMDKPSEDRPTVVKNLTELRAALEDNKRASESYRSISQKINTLGDILSQHTIRTTKEIESLEAAFSKLRPKADILKEIKKLELSKDTISGEIAQLEFTVADFYKKQTIVNGLAIHETKYQALVEELSNVNLRISSTAIKATEARNLLSGVIRLKEISDRASMEALESMISGINLNIRKYIDQIFPDDGTVVSIQNKKTIESGEERAKLSVRLSHKGSEPKSMKSWSGGEKSRVALAGQLGLADLYKSPFILIDEALAWLDKENKERCCEVFRSFTTDKLILVIEHGLPDSLVDHVINI